jgi:hypothetical protein
MCSGNLLKTEKQAAQTPALRDLIYLPKFDSATRVTGCGSLVLKKIKPSVINIRCSMLDVQAVHYFDQAEFYKRRTGLDLFPYPKTWT